MNSSTNSALTHNKIAAIAIGIIGANHAIGLVGLNLDKSRVLFENLSWINLLLSVVLVLLFHSVRNSGFYICCALSFAIGMAAEIAGVTTGFPFGAYHYTEVLGAGSAGVPFIIGLNWILLAYCTAVVLQHVTKNTWLRIGGAALLMTSLDFLLEPFAIRHNLWVWHNHVPPMQNYLAWFGVALIIQTIYAVLVKEATNKLAHAYLIILFLFLIADFVLSFF
ncbi:MAG: carotenoid biosynthesis protein [Chitinophagales bacterium]